MTFIILASNFLDEISVIISLLISILSLMVLLVTLITWTKSPRSFCRGKYFSKAYNILNPCPFTQSPQVPFLL